MPELPDLAPYLGQSPSGPVAVMMVGSEAEAVSAANKTDRLRPGVAGLVAALTRRLAAHPAVAPLLAVSPDLTDEPAIAAAHGAAHLALAVAAAHAVLGQQPAPSPGEPALSAAEPAAVVGVALGSAALLLRETPMPAGYAAALLARARAQYLLPRRTYGHVPVSGHRFALVEGDVPASADFSGNGLVAVVTGGAVIRTGTADGTVGVRLEVLAGPPPDVERGWDDVVEVSWRAESGLASVVGPEAPGDQRLYRQTPPWPGDYRLRVHARDRDDAEADGAASPEEYELMVWQAPAAPEVVHQRGDLLGFRLRGEPAPARAPQPHAAYRWVRDSALATGATITVVLGAGVDEVLHAFGADPEAPQSLRSLSERDLTEDTPDPWVAVLDLGGAVAAVEYNGYQGSREEVLCAASAGGRAASMFWNVNAMTSLSFAEHGSLLASLDVVLGDASDDVEVSEAVADLDFDDPRDTEAKGLLAVERFTGHAFTAADLARLEDADTGFQVVPRPPEEPD